MPPFATKSDPVVQKREIDRNSWAASFPDDIGNASRSTMFISRCIYIAFSHILASRRLLPQNVFKKRNIHRKLRVYVMNSSEILGARLVQKFRGVTDAIKQCFLRELTLVVSPTNEDVNDAIEMYTWRMRYDVDGEPQAELLQPDGTVMAALRFRGLQYLKKQTTELLLLLRILCRDTLSPLPAGASAVIRIAYTDRTPKGYQAPGFYRSPEDPVLRPVARQIELAALQTKYHGASVIVRSVFIDDEYILKMKLKERLRQCNPDDSLNDSFGGESDADDGSHRSANNDTIERISETALQQLKTVEMAREGVRIIGKTRSRSSTRSLDSDSSKLSGLSVAGSLSSVAGSGNSNSNSPAEDFPRRLRRLRHAVPKTGRDEPTHTCTESAASATTPVMKASTPPTKDPVNDSHDTPPSMKTPGVARYARVTPPAWRRK